MTDYEWLTQMGLCHRCRKQRAAPGRKHCFSCLERIREENAGRYDPEKAREYQARRREIYREKKEKGICVRCSRPASRGMYCHEHYIKMRRRSMERAGIRKRERAERGLVPEQRKKNGLCIWCGRPAVPGLHCCVEHQKKFSEAGLKGCQDGLASKNDHWINEVEAWRKRNRQKHSGNI